MKNFKIAPLVFSFVFLFNQIGFAQVTNTTASKAPTPPSEMTTIQKRLVWQMAISNLVAFQPKVVGAEKFIEKTKLKASNQISQNKLDELRKSKSFPSLSVQGDTLIIQDDSGEKITLTMNFEKTNEFIVNKQAFHIDPKKSILDQLEVFLKNQNSNNNKTNNLLRLLIQEANAQTEAKNKVKTDSDKDKGTQFVSGIASAAGMLIAGVAIALTWDKVALAEATSAAVLVGGAITFGAVNLYDANDVYVKKIECSSHGPRVEVQSVSGTSEIRTFNIENDKLTSIKIIHRPNSSDNSANLDLDMSSDARRIEKATFKNSLKTIEYTRPKSESELNKLQDLIRDNAFYKSICSPSNKKMLAEFNESIAKGQDKRRQAGATNEIVDDASTLSRRRGGDIKQ